MKIESRIEIIVEKNGNNYSFSMPTGVSYGETYDACFEALMKVAELSKDAAEKAKRQEEAPQ